MHPGFLKAQIKEIETSREDPSSCLEFLLDYQSLQMVVCPSHLVACDNESILMLLNDLELTFNESCYFDATGAADPYESELRCSRIIPYQLHLYNSRRGGGVIDRVWYDIGYIKTGLAGQIRRVLDGQLSRMNLVDCAQVDLETFAAAQKHENGRVRCFSTTRDRPLFDATMDTVLVDQPTLARIARAFDQRLGLPVPSFGKVWAWGEPTFQYDVVRRLKVRGENTLDNPIVHSIACVGASELKKRLVQGLRGDSAPEEAFL